MKTIEEAMLFVKQLIECNDAAGCGRCNDLRIAVKIIEEHLASRDSRILSAVPSDADNGLGKCVEPNCGKFAKKDYNGCGHYVCDYHYDKLNREFDEEYK